MAVILKNNSQGRLATALTASATTVTLRAGDTATFPSITKSGDWFPVTLVSTDSSVMEIVKCTGVSGNNLTVVRAQEDTTAKAFPVGAHAELRLTVATMLEFTKQETISNHNDLLGRNAQGAHDASAIGYKDSDVESSLDSLEKDVTYRKEIVRILDFPSHGKGYPQGLFIDKEANEIIIGNSRADSRTLFTFYDLKSGDEKYFLEVGGSGYPEGFTVIYEEGKRYLYTQTSSSTTSDIGKYDITGLLSGDIASLVESYPANAYYQMSFDGFYFYIENRTSGYGHTNRDIISIFDKDFNYSGELFLPPSLSGNNREERYGLPKRQSFSVRGGLVAYGMGRASASSNPDIYNDPKRIRNSAQGIRLLSVKGDVIKDSLMHNHSASKIISERTGLAITGIENEGVHIVDSSNIYTSFTTSGADKKIIIFKEFSSSHNAIDFSSAAVTVPFVPSVYYPPSAEKQYLTNPITGEVLGNFKELISFMRYYGVTEINFTSSWFRNFNYFSSEEIIISNDEEGALTSIFKNIDWTKRNDIKVTVFSTYWAEIKVTNPEGAEYNFRASLNQTSDELSLVYEGSLTNYPFIPDTVSGIHSLPTTSAGEGMWNHRIAVIDGYAMNQGNSVSMMLTGVGNYGSGLRTNLFLSAGVRGGRDLRVEAYALTKSAGAAWSNLLYYVEIEPLVFELWVRLPGYNNLSCAVVDLSDSRNKLANGRNFVGVSERYTSLPENAVMVQLERVLNTSNTVVDSNGFIKEASPICLLYDDRIVKNDFLELKKAELEKIGVGHYVIRNAPLLSRSGWYIETPKDRNNNIYFTLDYEENEGDLIIRTYEPDYSEGPAKNGNPIDIIEGRCVSLRFEEDEIVFS